MELYAGLLREELAGQTERLALLDRVERELKHLSGIVNDFLTYARRTRPALEPTDVGAIARDVAELLRPLATERKVALTCDAASVTARADAQQLRRAVLNLATNALQACPDDGSGKVTITVSASSGGAALAVRDNGAGMDASTRQKIFTPFYTTKQKGTGLGLAFVRDIAQDHGATLDVQSEPGSGTTFTLTLGA
jgi:signal transduction histidine kinase